jgi:predicted acylesterase/phospholipase RssA
VDLVAAEEVVHRRGRIAEAVGRSMSLPGVAPPIRADRRLHVDGGVLNNLPVDVMATDGEGPIIAVDVMRPFGGPPHGLPGLVDTISRSMVLGSWRKVEANRALANVLIAPRLDEIQMFDFGRLDEIVRHGRLAAEQALDENPLNVHG